MILVVVVACLHRRRRGVIVVAVMILSMILILTSAAAAVVGSACLLHSGDSIAVTDVAVGCAIAAAILITGKGESHFCFVFFGNVVIPSFV
jgi:hypothetical protein